jgi:hypothetical protein
MSGFLSIHDDQVSLRVPSDYNRHPASTTHEGQLSTRRSDVESKLSRGYFPHLSDNVPHANVLSSERERQGLGTVGRELFGFLESSELFGGLVAAGRVLYILTREKPQRGK